MSSEVSPASPVPLQAPVDSVQTSASQDPELIHRQNVYRILQEEEQQAMGKLFHQSQMSAKVFADKLARLGPKVALQIALPNDKGLQGRRQARRGQILENTSAIEAALAEASKALMEPSSARVPIKLDIELDGYKLRDSLLWCINDCSVTPEDFAAITCEDFELPSHLYVPAISKAIQEQLGEYQEYLGMLRMMGGLKEFAGIRGLIRLDITIEGLSVVDKFEWDLGETRNDPAAFAASYAKELALPHQFIPAITNDIYEQLYLLRRSLLQVGFHRDQSTGQLSKIHDPDLSELIAVFSSNTLVNRDAGRLEEFTPMVTILDAGELEKMEQSRDREARRKRRQAKAKKVESLSVRSPPKTMLTPLEYRGTVHRQLKLADDDDREPSAPSGRGRRRKV